MVVTEKEGTEKEEMEKEEIVMMVEMVVVDCLSAFVSLERTPSKFWIKE
jgi:hypothetical protein